MKITRSTSVEAYNGMKDKIAIKRQKELDNGEYHLCNIDSFIKVNSKIIIELNNILDISEKAFILSILPYLIYENNGIRYRNGKNIKLNELVKVTGISRGKLNTTINKLIDKGIISKDREGKATVYYLNPKIAYKGSRIPDIVQKKFEIDGELV